MSVASESMFIILFSSSSLISNREAEPVCAVIWDFPLYVTKMRKLAAPLPKIKFPQAEKCQNGLKKTLESVKISQVTEGMIKKKNPFK